MQTVSPAQILATPMQQPNDAEAATIRDYLIKLLSRLWLYQDRFDSKRPFGYSCWGSDLYEALIRAGHINGTLDDEGGIKEISTAQEELADVLIGSAIHALDAVAAA